MLELTTASLLEVLFLGVLSIFVCTWVLSNIRFRLDTAKYHARGKGESSLVRVPLKPYSLPFLGSALSFFDKEIGRFWSSLQQVCKSWNLQAVSILLAGVRTHIFFAPANILIVFRAKNLTRHKHARQLAINVLGMTADQAARAFPEFLDPKTNITLERVHTEYLLAQGPVTTLTNKFMECLLKGTSENVGSEDGSEVELYSWIKAILFDGSITALFGSKLLEMHPDLQGDFWIWEQNLLTLLFGTPKLFARQAYESRDRLLVKLEAWLAHGYKHTAELDDSVEWEPYFGARIMRKRHEYYNQQRLSLSSQAGKEMIFLAGILSNAIPTIGWLLTHLFSPTSDSELLPRIRDEVMTCQREDGSIDMRVLTRLPLLNSTINEVLRLYIDLLIIRQVEKGLIINGLQVHQNDQIMASSWMAHRHPDNFTNPEVFDAERFLQDDPKSGGHTASTSGLGGKYFPFGGGHHMCPGKNFARQEILGTVAVLLLNFDITFLSFIERQSGVLERKGSDPKHFPKMIKALPGNQVMGLDGDLLVKIKKKSSKDI
ncbi:Cytochrome P450 [Akanthomyces lecanii RCEF 1005]|uniref:Cytochrome P450 n=1 Tax=Akanthomyces lecanii RCEF 1005 TaxID=1081108 RepID=A0A162KLD0_CORDF|nr:Cytochrome P450 [Akanthomyces lecanii RCEF 1005]